MFLFLFLLKKITTTKINLFGKLYVTNVMTITFSSISKNLFISFTSPHALTRKTIWQKSSELLKLVNAECVQFINKNLYFNDI